MRDGTKTITSTNTNQKKYVVCRLDIYNKPGWFEMNSYADELDADIYCNMLNQDTDMIHRVFIEDEE